jgi:predicted amidohydrolase
MSAILTIATSQFAVSADVKKNLSAIQNQIRIAGSAGADIIHFCECSLSGYAGIDFNDVNEQDYWSLQTSIKLILELASLYRISIILGSHHFDKKHMNPYNSLYLINERGEIEDRYDKRLLTGLQGEQELKHYSPGEGAVVFEKNGVRCGLLICHEWRYPELYREYYQMGVQIIFQSWYDGNLSEEQYMAEGKELGELIPGTVRGNAANNYLWISASNTCKKESSFPAFVVQPDGRILHKLARNRAGVLISRIDVNQKFADPSALNRDRLKPKTP